MKKFGILLFALTILVGCDGGLSSDVNRKVMTSDNAISNYEWFKQQEQDIRAKYNQEERARKSLLDYKGMLDSDMAKWSRQDRDEYQRLKTVVDGIGYQVDQMVADYEAKLTMKHKEIFKDNLPTNIFRGVNQRLEFKYGIEVYKPHSN